VRFFVHVRFGSLRQAASNGSLRKAALRLGKSCGPLISLAFPVVGDFLRFHGTCLFSSALFDEIITLLEKIRKAQNFYFCFGITRNNNQG
jgi:hypothetical protein